MTVSKREVLKYLGALLLVMFWHFVLQLFQLSKTKTFISNLYLVFSEHGLQLNIVRDSH